MDDHKNRLSYTNLLTLRNAFLEELIQCTAGKTSHSLLHDSLNLKTKSLSKSTTVGGIILGGTHTRIYILNKFPRPEMRIIGERETPRFSHEDDFLNFIKSCCEMVHTNEYFLSLALSMKPIIRESLPDGILREGSKGFSFSPQHKIPIGQRMEEILSANHNNARVCVINDTFALLLGAAYEKKQERTIAYIVGTGTNSALYLTKETLMNVESGRFTHSILREMKNATLLQAPENRLFEHLVAGAYLFEEYNASLQSGEFSGDILKSTSELCAVANEKNQSPNRTHARSLFHRSAQLCAVQIAGYLALKQSDCTIIADGSVFWNGYHYRHTVMETLEHLEPRFHATLTKSPDAQPRALLNLAF